MALCDSQVSLKYIRSPRPARVPWSQKQNSNNKNTRKNKTKKVAVWLNWQRACLECKKLRVQSPDKKVLACNTSTRGERGRGRESGTERRERKKERMEERMKKKTSGRKRNKKRK